MFDYGEDYLVFVLGYDLLHDFFANHSHPEWSLVFDYCMDLVHRFYESDEYQKNNWSTDDALKLWIEKNRQEIELEYEIWSCI